MRALFRRWAVVFVLSGLNFAIAAEKPALVTLVESQGAYTAQDLRLIDHLNIAVIRNTLQNRYSNTSFLVGDTAHRFSFLKTITQLAQSGRELDVFILANADSNQIELASGNISLQEIEQKLEPLKHLNKGGLRFVYMAGAQGSGAAPDLSGWTKVWRDLGAQAVLTHNGGERLAPLFFPRLMTLWSQGASIADAANGAMQTSSEFTGAYGKYLSEEASQLRHGDLLATGPRLDGSNLDVTGKIAAHSPAIAPVRWPEIAPRRDTFVHTPLKAGVLEILTRILWPDVQLNSEFTPGLSSILESGSNPLWKTLQDTFPGQGPDEVFIPGVDIQNVLTKVIPGFDEYLGQIVDRLDVIKITRSDGKMKVDIWLVDGSLSLDFRKKKNAKRGQVYRTTLSRHLHFEIGMDLQSIWVSGIRGIKLYVKLPLMPDGVYPRELRLDTEEQKLKVKGDAFWGKVKVVANADVKARKFKGIDWLSSFFENFPLVISILTFVFG